MPEIDLLEDPLEGANCSFCGRTADNFHVSDELWAQVEPLLGQGQACFKCFRIAAWHAGVKNDGKPWEVSLADQREQIARLTDLFKPEPYHGVRFKLVCSTCGGQGEVPGRNHDDPRWTQCLNCKGDGLSATARAVLAGTLAAGGPASIPSTLDADEGR